MEITNTIRWVALISLLLFITLIITNLISDNMRNVAAISVGLVPIVVSILYLRKNAITAPSTILAVTIILLITWLATTGQGIHDIGLLGYPVILIVAGLILRGRVILYLAILIILCLAWLVFGDVYGLYVPVRFISGNPDDYFIASVVILTAGNTIYKLVKNVYDNLSRAEQEIAMREQAEADRESTIQQLRRKNQELDRFAIRVSHDLKTPLVKCRPPHNRTPERVELAACLPYLDRQIALVQPRLLVALGRPAAQALLDRELAISAARGKRFERHGIPVVVTYHPAYLLRNPQDKARAWEDLCFARQLMAGEA